MTDIRNPILIALLCCGLLQACSREASEASDVASKAPVKAGPPTIATPCSLLTDAEVREVAPLASSGRPDPSDLAAGIYACVWDTPTGRVWLQAYRTGPTTVDAEIHGFASGLVDPSKKQISDQVRIQDVPKVGDRAMAFAEKADPARGVLSSNAVLVTQRGDYMVTLFAPELALGDREAALRALQTLGGHLASRL
ncbi:MAG: hypothetical protein ACMG50_00080 [Thermomonas sp.]